MLHSTLDDSFMISPTLSCGPSEATLQLIRQAAYTYRTVHSGDMQLTTCLN